MNIGWERDKLREQLWNDVDKFPELPKSADFLVLINHIILTSFDRGLELGQEHFLEKLKRIASNADIWEDL